VSIEVNDQFSCEFKLTDMKLIVSEVFGFLRVNELCGTVKDFGGCKRFYGCPPKTFTVRQNLLRHPMLGKLFQGIFNSSTLQTLRLRLRPYVVKWYTEKTHLGPNLCFCTNMVDHGK
jgi:hypothetical protein